MSYQVLARKWRPASFEQVVGQEHVLKALSHALEQNRLHHAYLFSGTRGVGKTSIARLLAKGLNCEHGVTSHPCGKCQACVEISEGRFVDLIEIDAASRTKVDDTREVLDNVQYQPVRGRFKIYLIDEVHMLSRHSFNALLKTLEEPPAHVKFLLATTDPQKLPVTVLSRCLQFNLKALIPSRIQAHLADVLAKEGVEFEAPALALLARAADGSVRDSLSLTDQAIAHSGGVVTKASVQEMLGSLDTEFAVRLMLLLCDGGPAGLIDLVDELESFSPDYDDLIRQLAALLHQVALTQFNLRARELTDHGDVVADLAQQLDREQVQLWYQILIQGRQDLAFAPDPRSGFEMVMLRALAFSPLNTIEPMMAKQSGAPSQSQLAPDPSSSVTSMVETPTGQNTVTSHESSAKADAVDNQDLPDLVKDEDAANEAAIQAEQEMVLAQADMLRGESLIPELELISSANSQSELDPRETPASTPEPTAPASVESTSVSPDMVTEQSPSPNSEMQSLLAKALANHRSLRQRVDQLDKTDSTPVNTPPSIPSYRVPDNNVLNSGVDAQAQSEGVASIEETASTRANSVPPYAVEAATTEIPTEVAPPNVSLIATEAEHQSQQQPLSSDNEAIKPPSAPNNAESDLDQFWYETMSQLQVGGRPRQLAINSILERQGDLVCLTLKEEQRHLNSDSVIVPLTEALSTLWSSPIQLKIDVGEISGRETPLQIRKRLHQERLVEAKQSLLADDNVQWLQAELGASLIEESVTYQND